MAWNGSDTEKVKVRGEGEQRRGKLRSSTSTSTQHFNNKALLAGLVVVIGGGLAVWLFMGGEKGETGERVDVKPSKITEVKPAVVTNAVETVDKPVKKRYNDMTDAEKLQSIRDEYGNNIPESLKSTVYFLEHPVSQSFRETQPSYKIFKHMSENDIASLLVVEPGNYFLQKPFYDENFDRDFQKSLEEDIEFDDGDTDEQRELKQAVIDTKKEMAERAKAGEKPSDILNAAVDQMYELGVYKEQLQGMLNEYHADAKYTDKDIEDFITAANEMLGKRGASPLQMPNFTMRQAKLNAIQRRKEAQQESDNQR